MIPLRARRIYILSLVLAVAIYSIVSQKLTSRRLGHLRPFSVATEQHHLIDNTHKNHSHGHLYAANSPSKQISTIAGVDPNILVEGAMKPAIITPGAFNRHEYLANGLLAANPSVDEHPISELIYRAEQEWDAKLKRQSKTLPEAVDEYHRRYGRAPPQGFDRWWSYVQKHNVLLPDEYDQIERDLAPYWGIHPYDLRRLIAEWEHHPDSFVLTNEGNGGAIYVTNANLAPQNEAHFLSVAEEHIGLLRPVQDAIPEFRAIFTPHDNPMLVKDWIHHQAALNASSMGTYVNLNNLPRSSARGLASACPPEAPMRDPSGPKISHTKSTSSVSSTHFIYDHRLAMDPCQTPTHLSQIGQFFDNTVSPMRGITLTPQFAYCSTWLHTDITVATAINWLDDLRAEDNPPWEARQDKRLMWRGSPTGVFFGDMRMWARSQRARLVKFVSAEDSHDDVIQPHRSKNRLSLSWWAERMARFYDIGFSTSPETEPLRTEWLEETFGKDWKNPISFTDAGNYKYVLDVDGNGWSARFKRLMTSYALVFKSTVYPEWFTDRVQPWVHYVPVQVDYSDLEDTLLFFRGDVDNETGDDIGGHEDLARRIAEAGRVWSLTIWRQEDLTAYMFRLFLEYARVTSMDRDAMFFRLPSDIHSHHDLH